MGYFSELDARIKELSADRENPIYAGETKKQVEENISELLKIGLSLDEISAFLPGSVSPKVIERVYEMKDQSPTKTSSPVQKVKK